MADVTITYEGNTIADLSATGTKTLLTAGKYCDDNITVDYVSPGGGGTLPKICCAIVGSSNITGGINIGVNPETHAEAHMYDSEYISYDSTTSVFTILQSGTYNIKYYAKGTRNSSGSAVDALFTLYYGGSSTTGSTGVSGVSNTLNAVTLNANDTVYLNLKPSSTARVDAFFSVEKIS